MSRYAERLKSYYVSGRWPAEAIDAALEKGRISQSERDEILAAKDVKEDER